MALMPECGKCGKRHWHFAKCEDADKVAVAHAEREAAREAEAAAAPDLVARPVIPVFRSGTEFAGDRLKNFERTGNTFWRKPEEAA